MAKMFYRENEAKEIFNMSTEELKQMTREGRLREFRDGTQVMYKADQVDALVAVLKANKAKEDTSLGIELEDEGSGLLELSREKDDTSLGDCVVEEITGPNIKDLVPDKDFELSEPAKEILSKLLSLSSHLKPVKTDYNYEAMNPSGQCVSGVVSAYDDAAAIAEVRNRGYFPTSVKKVKKYGNPAKSVLYSGAYKKTGNKVGNQFVNVLWKMIKVGFIFAVGFAAALTAVSFGILKI